MIELYVFGAANERNRRVVPPLLAAYNKNGLLVFLTVSFILPMICMLLIILHIGKPPDRINQSVDQDNVYQ
jgi:hypothetical protein